MVVGEDQVSDTLKKYTKLIKFLERDDVLRRFTSIRYEQPLAYSGARWQDDIPLVLMQHPDRLQFLKPEERETMLSFGQMISGAGLQETEGPFKRMYRENALLETANKLYSDTVNAPEQDLKKALVEINAAVATVNGNIPACICS